MKREPILPIVNLAMVLILIPPLLAPSAARAQETAPRSPASTMPLGIALESYPYP
jgi:hypothetical protein